MKVKYIKVNVADRLPEKDGWQIIERNNSNVVESYFFKAKNEFSNDDAMFWLEPVPDREEEMREMLDECRTQLEYLNELQDRGTTNCVLSRLTTLLNELKK